MDITRTVSLGARVPRVPILHGRKAVKAGRVCHRRLLHHASRQKTVTRFQPGFWVCLTVQNARIKTTRGRPSADELSHHTSSQHPTKRRRLATRAHDEGLPQEIVSMVGSPTRPAGGDAPARSPRARRQRTSGQPPLAEFGRVASRLAVAGLALACSGWRGRRGRPKRKLRDTRPSTPPSRGCVGRTSPPATSPVIFPAVRCHR